jgi:alpha-L-rhamnosidase
VAEYEYVMRTGDIEQLRGVKARMVELLGLMAKDLDSRNVYAGKGKPFVDWSKGFSGESPEARRAVHFEYLYAFRKAALLFEELRDDADRDKCKAIAEAMGVAASKYLEDADGSFGDRWETNAIYYLADVRWPLKVPNSGVVWPILRRATTGRKPTDVITPYYGSYLLQALAGIGGSYDGLQWTKSYWGGMLDNGATSFWEAWDPAWAGDDPHAKLEADDKVGYNASLAHGWSSGPAAWLLEQVLGVKAYWRDGHSGILVKPDLGGLQWVKGSVATPMGAVKVEASEKRILVVVPAEMQSGIHLPMGNWTCKGVKIDMGAPGQNGITLMANGEWLVDLPHGGQYEFLKQ